METAKTLSRQSQHVINKKYELDQLGRVEKIIHQKGVQVHGDFKIGDEIELNGKLGLKIENPFGRGNIKIEKGIIIGFDRLKRTDKWISIYVEKLQNSEDWRSQIKHTKFCTDYLEGHENSNVMYISLEDLIPPVIEEKAEEV